MRATGPVSRQTTDPTAIAALWNTADTGDHEPMDEGASAGASGNAAQFGGWVWCQIGGFRRLMVMPMLG